MKLKPQGNRLLVRLIVAKETDTSIKELKLILPENAQTYGMPRKGEIIAVGNGHECIERNYQEGDIVYFSMYAGQPMQISPRTHSALEKFEETAQYLFLNTKDIYGRTYEKKEECLSRRLGDGEGNTGSDGNVFQSKEQHELTRTEASAICDQLEERK